MPRDGTSCVDRAQLSRFLPEDTDRVYSSKHCFEITNGSMNNVQKVYTKLVELHIKIARRVFNYFRSKTVVALSQLA